MVVKKMTESDLDMMNNEYTISKFKKYTRYTSTVQCLHVTVRVHRLQH
jgi:hypothetical protein